MKLFSIGNTFRGPCAYVIAENKEQAIEKWLNSEEHKDYVNWDYVFNNVNNIKEVENGIFVMPNIS